MAEVSYILTSYNKAAFLPCVLESIRREQESTGGQVIIIDDGSIDESPEICRNFIDFLPGALLIQQCKRGVYAALNRVIPLARSPWIRLCDGDDPLIPGSTRYLVEIAERDGATIAYGGVIDYGPEPLALDALDRPPPANKRSYVHSDAILHLIQAMDFTTSQAVYRTGATKSVLPLPETLISCQDFALALRMTSTGKLVRVPDPVCFHMSGAPNQFGASLALTRHQTIRILQASRMILTPRHRRAAVTSFYKWRRRELRRQLHGIAFQRKKVLLKTISAAAKFGFYDWHRALDAFAAPYEQQLNDSISRRTTPI